MPRLTLPALAAATLCAAAPAWAASIASASLGPLSMWLVDLDTTDGIDASITFAYADTYVSSHAYNTQTGEYVSDSLFGAGAWAPVASSSAVGGASAQAALTGPGGADGSSLTTSGQAAGLTPVPGENHYTQFGANVYPGYGSASFSLSANTLVVFEAAATVSAEVTGTWDPASHYGMEVAQTAATLDIYGSGPNGGGWQSSSDGVSAYVQSLAIYDESYELDYYYTGDSRSDARLLAGSFLNLTGGTLDGTLQLGAYVYGYSYAAAVPEAETYALMLAGLAVVGRLARRRQG